MTRLIATAGALALAVSLLMTPANATPTVAAAGSFDGGPDHDPLQAIADAYLASLPGLTADKAKAAAVAQAAGEPLKDAVAENWKVFGGGWFDPFTATYHLAVTDAATGEALAKVGSTERVGVRTPLVARSLDQLEAQAEELRGASSKLGVAAAGNVGVDVTTNQVVAAVPADQVAELAAEAPAGVVVVAAEKLDDELDACTSRANCDNFLASGLMIRAGSGTPAPGASCSLGFTARDAANQRITLTAGHCSSGIGQTWSNGVSPNRVIGRVGNRIDSGRRDVSRIVSANSFYGNVNRGVIYIGPPAVTAPVKGKTFLLRNDVVCLSASFQNPGRFGNPCARVSLLFDPFKRGMVRISGYDACPGDSGGGWYWLTARGNRYAAALHSRSNPRCNNGSTSWASPLTAFHPDLRYEVS